MENLLIAVALWCLNAPNITTCRTQILSCLQTKPSDERMVECFKLTNKTKVLKCGPSLPLPTPVECYNQEIENQ